jgi:CubicO group peptidase (beta-lactamase class C family)
LSQALSFRASLNYDSLLLKRVIAPLKLTHTGFTLSPAMKASLAVGHDFSLQPAPLVAGLPGYAIMPAAGGLYSTVEDLLKIPSVAMGYQPSPLAPAIAASLRTHRPIVLGKEQALGWIVIGKDDDHLIFHDGGSFGYASAVAWDPAKRVGIAVLSNHAATVSDIVRHLLRPDFPLEKPMVTKQTEISLDAGALGHYAGQYDAPGEGIFAIKLEGDFLTFAAPAEWGLPKLRLHPKSKQDFFATELPLRVTFQSDSAGYVNSMLVYPPRGQKAVPANRVGSDN